MFDSATLRKTGEFLLAQKRIRLLLHKRPDGDVLGSCLGLARFLAARGVDAAVLAPFECSAKFDFLPGFDTLEDGREEVRNPDFAETLYVIVDSTGVDRTGFKEGDFERLLRIDHHIGGSNYHDLDLASTAYGAAALLIYDLIQAMDPDGIDAPIADCLYTGIMTDTGGFRYVNTNAHVFHAASDLVERGARPSAVASFIYDRRDPAYLSLMRRALESLSFYKDQRVALLTLTPDGLPPEALALFGEDDFINLPRGLAPVEVVVQMKLAADGDWKVGFRSKGRVNVQAVATHFGGGGHFAASGCELQGEETEIREMVIERVFEALRDADL